ncbi:MAG: AAA family ATPase [Variovorax sp.]|nr:MAG: AAA family ATPase [Variovorax sp.]
MQEALSDEELEPLLQRVLEADVYNEQLLAQGISRIDAPFTREVSDAELLRYPSIAKLYKNEAYPAVTRLLQMVGMESLKMFVDELAELVEDCPDVHGRNLTNASIPNLSIILSGKSGSGKSTSARLYAAALAELGFVGRDDRLYDTGGPAGLIERNLNASVPNLLAILDKHRVVFIDEADGLARNNEITGKEEQAVLNALVARMDGGSDPTGKPARRKPIVILAIYDTAVDKLLRCNQGLRRRFTTLHLEAHDTPERLVIARAMLQRLGYVMDEKTFVKTMGVVLRTTVDRVEEKVKEAIRRKKARVRAMGQDVPLVDRLKLEEVDFGKAIEKQLTLWLRRATGRRDALV